MKEINDAWQAASQDIYNATQAQGGAANPFGANDPFAQASANANSGAGSAQGTQDNEVKDVDFEEVK
jgi:molecular chaperone DnaK